MRYALAAILLFVATISYAQDSYIIQPEDVLTIRIPQNSGYNQTLTVKPDGIVYYPGIGRMRVAGRSVTAFRSSIRNRIESEVATRPAIYISVKSKSTKDLTDEEAEGNVSSEVASKTANGTKKPGAARGNSRIHLIGSVPKPGVIEVPQGTTFLQFLAKMGTLGKFAATKRIQLRRINGDGEEVIFTLNYKNIQNGDPRIGRITLRDNDVIIVPQRRLFE